MARTIRANARYNQDRIRGRVRDIPKRQQREMESWVAQAAVANLIVDAVAEPNFGYLDEDVQV